MIPWIARRVDHNVCLMLEAGVSRKQQEMCGICMSVKDICNAFVNKYFSANLQPFFTPEWYLQVMLCKTQWRNKN